MDKNELYRIRYAAKMTNCSRHRSMLMAVMTKALVVSSVARFVEYLKKEHL